MSQAPCNKRAFVDLYGRNSGSPQSPAQTKAEKSHQVRRENELVCSGLQKQDLRKDSLMGLQHAGEKRAAFLVHTPLSHARELVVSFCLWARIKDLKKFPVMHWRQADGSDCFHRQWKGSTPGVVWFIENISELFGIGSWFLFNTLSKIVEHRAGEVTQSERGFVSKRTSF